jgi:hypothetical protein
MHSPTASSATACTARSSPARLRPRVAVAGLPIASERATVSGFHRPDRLSCLERGRDRGTALRLAADQPGTAPSTSPSSRNSVNAWFSFV